MKDAVTTLAVPRDVRITEREPSAFVRRCSALADADVEELERIRAQRRQQLAATVTRLTGKEPTP